MNEQLEMLLIFLPAIIMAIIVVVLQTVGDIRQLKPRVKLTDPGNSFIAAWESTRDVLRSQYQRAFRTHTFHSLLVLFVRINIVLYFYNWVLVFGVRTIDPIIVMFVLLLAYGLFAQIGVKKYSFNTRISLLLLSPFVIVAELVRIRK